MDVEVTAWRRRVAGASLVALGVVGCDDSQVFQVTSRIEVEPTRIDFGVVDISQDAVETAVIRNLDNGIAKFESIEVVDDCGGCFRASTRAAQVSPFGETTLDLRFRPIREAVASATVTIMLDNANAVPVDVQLTGRGRDGCAPDVEVAPPAVDFGFVPAGGVGLSSFVLRSTGDCDLFIDRIRVIPDDAPFRVTTSTPTPAQPGVLISGEQTSVGLRATLDETATGTTTASIEIETNVSIEKNVPGRPGVVRVPLSALANNPPVADAGDDLIVEPWSRATLDGSNSFDPDGPDDSLQYQWTLATQPGGSTTRLERSTTPQPSFWADLTGIYELELVVVDNLGLESEPSRVVVEAFPTNAVRIELTWDHPDSDVDLHLIRQGGLFCECIEDVHYRDCGRAPDWFPAAPGANPRLDIDDRKGFGPENINLDGEGPQRFIPAGAYTIAVHYFATNAADSDWPTSTSTATVRIFINGLLAAEFSRALDNDRDLWTVGELRWPDQTVVEIDSLTGGVPCGIF